ncbi:MAG: hypothetical protein H6509_12060 [Bryobacterales bacterium]|nr:hypothetical protein [Bryobacterales bacterium]
MSIAKAGIVAGICAAAAFAAGPILLRDVDGVSHGTLQDGERKATVLFFVLTDCPISNVFAPEIDRICTEYGEKGVGCFLVYVDPEKSDAEIRAHAAAFGHGDRPAIHDVDRALTEKVGATITPEAAVFSPSGEMIYRGRIDNLYASLGKARRQATEHDLRNALDEILAGAPVTTPRTQAIGCFMPPKTL